ncbi:hypothetical protein [Oceanobacter sp. 3_MG-2023]|uniref:hypothetical protein n=1 Tax=Oceanobacter sp. 3_MG-2023 TaxID=3062622 RepID=UPI0027375B82|nr:hypothetical protein [Oceanobacter sp. 3_MG-2023]MDP2505381.1 hypothetical protein [Oceanobacter sp. 3_MG-2023]
MSIKAKIASLVVELSANSATFNSELKKSQSNTHDWAEDVKKSAKIGAAAIAASAAAGAAALTALTVESMANVDAMAKHADKIGITTEALAGLRHQAELNGVSQNNLDMGLQRMVRRVAEAAQGTGEAVSALDELGLSAKELNNLSPDEQFSRIAAAMGDVDTQSDKVRLAFKLFDSGGVGLVNAMRGGPEALAAAAEEAEQLGLAVSRVDAAKIEAANDAGDRAAKVFDGLGNTLAVAISPVLTAIKTDFVESAKASDGFKDTVDQGMQLAVMAVGAVADVVNGLEVVWKGAELLVATFVATAVQNLLTVRDGVLDLINIIPGIDVQADRNSGLALWAKVSSDQVAELTKELNAAAMAPPPSEKISDWYQRVTEEAERAGEEVAKTATLLATGGSEKSGTTISDKLIADLERVSNEMKTQQERIEEAYASRQSIIESSLQSGLISEQKYQQLSQRSEAEHQAALASLKTSGINDQLITDLQSVESELQTQREQIQETYASRQAIIEDALQNELITEQKYQQLSQRNTAEHEAALAALKKSNNDMTLADSSDFFGNMATMAEAGYGQQSKLFKTMATANALVKTYEGATSAYAALAPIPIVGPGLGIAAAGAAITMGMTNVRAISAVGMAHDGLDEVPKTGSWILEEGERVTTAKTSAKLDATLDQVQQGGTGNTYVTVHNNAAGTEATTTETTNGLDRYVDVIIQKAQQAVAKDIYDGGGAVSRAGEARYNWRRGVA